MSPLITYVLIPICEVFVARFLYTLYKYSEPGTFKVIVIDQTKDQFSKPLMDYIKDKVHLYMHPSRNLGYGKAMNEGILHGLHWGTPLICPANDDIEIMDSRWIQGVWDTFKKDERIMGVIPMSPRVAGWGYGLDFNPELLPYKTEYTKADYDYLLNGDFSDQNEKNWPKHLPRKQKDSIVDAGAFIMPYFKREIFEKVGLYDEHFFPGSGEDYDYLARAYGKGYRIVSSSLVWVWHHWTKSKDLFASGQLEDPYYKPLDHPYWNDIDYLWPPKLNEGHKHDVWGHYTNTENKKVPLKRIDEVFVDQI